MPRWDPIKETRDILSFYEKMFGPYPFETFCIVHRSWEEIGGHSPASFIVLNQLPRVLSSALITKSNSPVNLVRWNEYFLAHEIAHQWWGQGVTWASYHDQWISEGLAQFSTILYLEEKHGESAFSDIVKRMSKWVEKKTDWGPIIFGSRISYFDFFAFQAIIYNKTSLVLNMLKDMLGDELFFSGLREFFSRYKHGAARTGNFIAIFSEVSGQDLAPFFDGWFRSHLLPEVKVERDQRREENEYVLRFKIIQSREPFVFPLWIEWFEDGKCPANFADSEGVRPEGHSKRSLMSISYLLIISLRVVGLSPKYSAAFF
jgi:aminopeptidase N